MDIIINPGRSTKTIDDYFYFNDIPVRRKNLGTKIDGMFSVSLLDLAARSSRPTLVIMDFLLFMDMATNDVYQSDLLGFARTPGCHIWVWSDMDGGLNTVSRAEQIRYLDARAHGCNIVYFLDMQPRESSYLLKLCNIRIEIFPVPWSAFVPRIRGADLTKHDCTYDFLLTTVLHPDRPHRWILQQELSLLPDLSARGQIHIHDKKGAWLGDPGPSNMLRDHHASMDLYRDCWIELVPETLWDHGWFITEKTIKPMATRTPFLVLSCPGYLRYLRSRGFKTFGDVWDESYDDIEDLGNRTKAVLAVLAYIGRKGADRVYRSCRKILDHNFHRLAFMSGMRQAVMDRYISKLLADIS